jgi:hypothetical protein
MLRDKFDDPGQDDVYYRTKEQVSEHNKLAIEEIIWTLLFLILSASLICTCFCYFTSTFDKQIKEMILLKTNNNNIVHT